MLTKGVLLEICDDSECGNNYWSRKGDLCLLNGPQRTPEWHEARKNRVTASQVNAAITNPTTTALSILNSVRIEPNENMIRGTLYEPTIRNYYSKVNKVVVREVAFAFRDSFPYLGVSPDGLVGRDGLIEIKCPTSMYKPLLSQIRTHDHRGVPSHIWSSHYAQMQSQMAVMGRKWCDYVVYCPAEQLYYVERIYYNAIYWKETKEKLEDFVGFLEDSEVLVLDD